MEAVAAEGYRAISLDMRGYGRSSAPADPTQYTVFQTVGDLIGLLDALDLAQVVIVGHDFGASVAWNAAPVSKRWPHDTLEIVVVDLKIVPSWFFECRHATDGQLVGKSSGLSAERSECARGRLVCIGGAGRRRRDRFAAVLLCSKVARHFQAPDRLVPEMDDASGFDDAIHLTTRLRWVHFRSSLGYSPAQGLP